MQASKSAQNTVIITHERYLVEKDEYPHELVIIDEDIIRTAYSCNVVSFEEISRAFRVIFGHKAEFQPEEFSKIQEFHLALAMNGDYKGWVAFNSLKLKQKSLDVIAKVLGNDRGITENVIGLFSSDLYTQNTKDGPKKGSIYYLSVRPIKKKGARHLILSATIPEEIAISVFGQDVEYYNSGSIETKGRVIQYREKSFSKYLMDNDPMLLSKLTDNLNMPIITHKRYKSRLDRCHSFMHFGNTEGLNEYAGMNIAVVGTPYMPFPVYLLMAVAFGFADCEKEYSDAPVTKSRVLNGIESKFTAVADDEILTVQNYLVSSQLIQATGRARIIDNNVEVLLFSNWPVFEAEINEAPSWLYEGVDSDKVIDLAFEYDLFDEYEQTEVA